MKRCFCSSDADELDRLDRALIEQRSIRKADVGRIPHLERRPEENLRQTLAAVLGGYGQTDPARVSELLIGLLEAWGRRHLAVVPRAAGCVADPIERVEDAAAAKPAASSRIESSTSRRLLAAWKCGDAVYAGELAKDELHIPQWGSVDAHGVSSPTTIVPSEANVCESDK